MSLLASFSFAQWAVALSLIGVCCLLILVVLVQQASGGGLVGAFGGGGGGGAFGAKTGDMFTIITVAIASVYLLLAVIGNYVFQPMDLAAPPALVVSTLPELPVAVDDVVPDSAEFLPAGTTGAAGGDSGTSGSASEGGGSAPGTEPASEPPPGNP